MFFRTVLKICVSAINQVLAVPNHDIKFVSQQSQSPHYRHHIQAFTANIVSNARATQGNGQKTVRATLLFSSREE
ncbi:hypothetical protein DM02DRAFT_657700 [Periconia macrospinosa]|uniref:Secreted protein n=1 Tax=Periconia macrospinosa TaxID=97972 RepID=A0A2V1DIZ9_9PLEO|nr:hypothetical protein DM02DRAFT_657700 [Periconia macrospinosa]